ncbi:general transcription factor 3C polypeptide 6 [Spea bombifrons]|uniref:general transcription factor 3C polypeptide 6 n=1 Tax=Spea bombifrons TaxID=233779 RepID=UPI002349792C|nr:general transcription factor 3C polypeptide 6 [Spea bombifrons]
MSAPSSEAKRFLGDASSSAAAAEEDEYEVVEEQLVLVELTGIIDLDILEKCDNRCKILGINTEKPFLQVDKYVFAGEYEDALGTFVIFEETSEQVDGDNPKPQLKYKCHTTKKLNMTRTFLTEKKEGDEGVDKVEWFQIKDDDNACWPNMICNFAQEGEEGENAEDASQSEPEEEQEQLDVSTEDSGNLEQSVDNEKQDSEMEESVSHPACQQEGQDLSQLTEETSSKDQGEQSSHE